MGRVVNQRELAEVFGVSHQAMANWNREGMPAQKRGENGQENEYDTAAVIAWYTAREVAKVGSESQRDRLTRLQGDELQAKLAIQNNTLVPVEHIEPVWTSRVLTAAAFLMGQHSRLAAILEATPGVEAKREVIKATFAEFLTRLGVDGPAMQVQAEALLLLAADAKTAALLRTFTESALYGAAQPATQKKHDDPSTADENSGVGVGSARPAEEGPPVGLG